MKKNAEAQVLRLWKNYQDIKIGLNSTITRLPDDAFIISACNPKSQFCAASTNRLKTEKLQRYLQRNAIRFQYLLVGDPEFAWYEPSFLVHIPKYKACNLARIYQQNAIYQTKQGQLWLVPVLLAQFPEVMMGDVFRFI